MIHMLGKIALKFFGRLTEPHLDYFDSLGRNIKGGRMGVSLHEYVSTLFLLSFLTFIVTMIVGTVIITFTLIATIYSYTLAIILSLIAAGGVFFIGYYYPSIKAKNIKSHIDRSLPFAVFYMATAASSGVNPVEIFKALSMKGGIIGDEARRIYSNVNTLGMNLSDAIQRSAERTPSQSFSELLWGLTSVITTGGDIEDYLVGKTRTFMNQYRRALDEYGGQVALYTEIYITLVIVGTLFFIVLLAIITPLTGGSSLLLQSFIIFLFIPLISIGFIILLRGMSPTG